MLAKNLGNPDFRTSEKAARRLPRYRRAQRLPFSHSPSCSRTANHFSPTSSRGQRPTKQDLILLLSLPQRFSPAKKVPPLPVPVRNFGHQITMLKLHLLRATKSASSCPPGRLLLSSRTRFQPRGFSTSLRSKNQADLSSSATQATPSREMREVDRLDVLLTRIREKTDPSNSALISVRSPSLWSERLHAAQMKTVAPTGPSETRISPDDPLPPRHMHESYCQVDLPFASNPQFLEKYTNAHGGIRTGMLMEHLDSLAGSISYKHCVSCL